MDKLTQDDIVMILHAHRFRSRRAAKLELYRRTGGRLKAAPDLDRLRAHAVTREDWLEIQERIEVFQQQRIASGEDQRPRIPYEERLRRKLFPWQRPPGAGDRNGNAR